jgi:hypothetical protein
MRRRANPDRVAALSFAILAALVALTISGVISATAGGTETRSLTSSADTQIVENAPTKNYGAATSLGVNGNVPSGSAKDEFALLKWDLSGIVPGTQINSASVTLSVTTASPQTYQGYVLKRPWVEPAATWNVYSSGKPWEVAGAKGSLDKEATVAGTITPSLKGKNTLTLPLAVVQGWVDNPSTNQGIIIANPSSTRGFNFNSREVSDPTRRPKLTLDLNPDTTPPETTIDSGPSGTISSGDASFTFSSSEAGSTLECSLDSAAYTACTSPKSFMNLSDGSHTFKVRATDAAGNTDASPASTTWTVDTTAPETTIDSGPSGTTTVAEATFAFFSEEGATFECRLDGAAYSACTSPERYTVLTDGSHTFQVRATDAVGNTDTSPASWSFTSDTTPPTISTVEPADEATGVGATSNVQAAFSEAMNSSTIDGSTFTLAKQDFTAPVAAQVTYDPVSKKAMLDPESDLEADATYTATLKGGVGGVKDDAGNPLAEDETWSFTTAAASSPADTTPPETTIDSGPSGTVSTTSVSFAFSSSEEAGSTFRCQLDPLESAPASCTSPKVYSGLMAGSEYTFSVWATDASGNTDATPATSTFTLLKTVTNVRDFGATGSDTSNDTAAFENAMAEAARLGESTYVPSGTYYLAGVNPPNNTHLEVQAGVVFKKFGTANGPLFVEQGPTDATFAHDIYIEGVGGKFTMDLNDAGADTAAIRVSNVNGFSLKNADCIQNNDNQQMLLPTSYKPCLAFLSANTTLNNGIYNAPHNGVIDNVHSFKSPYGFGLTQFNGGSNIQLTNISSEGGVPLRVESFKSNATPMDNIIADGVTCKNGHDAVHMNPHGMNHGTITVRNVTADSCESAVSIKTDSTLGGSYASDSSIDGVTVIPGNLAQDRDSDPTNDTGSWVVGPSKWCIDNDDSLGHTIGLSNVDCGGLSNRRP